MISAVDEFFAVLADNDLILAALRQCFNVADDLCVDIEGLGNIDDALSYALIAIEFDTMTAVEYLEHLLHWDLA